MMRMETPNTEVCSLNPHEDDTRSLHKFRSPDLPAYLNLDSVALGWKYWTPESTCWRPDNIIKVSLACFPVLQESSTCGLSSLI